MLPSRGPQKTFELQCRTGICTSLTKCNCYHSHGITPPPPPQQKIIMIMNKGQQTNKNNKTYTISFCRTMSTGEISKYFCVSKCVWILSIWEHTVHCETMYIVLFLKAHDVIYDLPWVIVFKIFNFCPNRLDKSLTFTCSAVQDFCISCYLRKQGYVIFGDSVARQTLREKCATSIRVY